MSQAPQSRTAMHRAATGMGRLIRAYRTLPHERRLAAYAALGLFLTLFLPWYQRQFFAVVNGKPVPAADSQTAWGAFSFVEAAVLLVAAGVLTLLYQRAEGRAFHLPGGDGGVITAAGLWTCVLVLWRIFDKQGGQATGQAVITYGIEWGIFVALAVAIFLTYAGTRIRAAHRPEPPLPGDERWRAPNGGEPSPPRVPRRPASLRSPVPGRAPEADRRVRPPRPVPAEDPPTLPTTPGSRTRPKRPPDDQLTIPLEEND